MSFSEADYAAAAARLGVEVAAIKAVAEVESNGDGFLPDGRPKILFEAHHFGARTGHQYDITHPDISAPNWGEGRRQYIGGPAEYGRQARAAALDERAALESASYGYFQVMGFNWRTLGYASVDAFVASMRTAAGQLDAFLRYIERNSLALLMRRFPDMAAIEGFTARYNGTGQVDIYAPKILDAFLRHSGGTAARTLRQGDQGEDVIKLQTALAGLGWPVGPIDGDMGGRTTEAVKSFQRASGLIPDGIVGKKTRAILGMEE